MSPGNHFVAFRDIASYVRRRRRRATKAVRQIDPVEAKGLTMSVLLRTIM